MIAAATTTSDKAPTAWAGPKLVEGKKNAVTLVNTVVARKRAVQLSSLVARTMPWSTMTPETIPVRLKATCTEVNVDVDSPKIMTLPLWKTCWAFSSRNGAFVPGDRLSTVCWRSCPNSAFHRRFRHPRRPSCAPQRVRDTGTARHDRRPDTQSVVHLECAAKA